MSERPGQWRPAHAAAFEDAEVARIYRHRPTYAHDAITFVASLCLPGVRTALDLGAGTGFVARALVDSMERVDAIDVSAAMIAEGRAAERGDDPRIRWIVARAEDAPLDGPYGLATAGDSLHWMEWDVVLPRVARALAPTARLAILETAVEPWPAGDPMVDVIRRYSVYGDSFRRFDLVQELETRGHFHREGDRMFRARFAQDKKSFIASFHARASLAVSRIGPQAAAAFDEQLARIVDRDPDRYLVRDLGTRVTWGAPIG